MLLGGCAGRARAQLVDRAVHLGGARVETRLQAVLSEVSTTLRGRLFGAVVRVEHTALGVSIVKAHASYGVYARVVQRLRELQAEVRALGSPHGAEPSYFDARGGGGGIRCDRSECCGEDDESRHVEKHSSTII